MPAPLSEQALVPGSGRPHTGSIVSKHLTPNPRPSHSQPVAGGSV